MYPSSRTKLLVYALILVLFGLIAILTSGCGGAPIVDEQGQIVEQAPVVEQTEPVEVAPSWAQVDRAGSWERMYDSETGVVCYSKDGVDQQSCFYLGGQ